MKELRAARGLTQERLAELAEVDYKHVQRLEGSTAPAVRVDTLEKLCIAFDITLAEFFAGAEFMGSRPRRRGA